MHMRTSRTGRTEQLALTQVRLQQAARKEFAERGVAGASIERISEAAGFSRGAFYSRYAGKHDLLLELLEEHRSREIEAWQSLLETEGSLEELLPILRERFDVLAQNSGDFLFDLELRVEALRNPVIADRYRILAANISERIDALAVAFIARSGARGVSVNLLGTALRSFGSQLAAEGRLGMSDTGESPGERLVALIVELLGKGEPPPTADKA